MLPCGFCKIFKNNYFVKHMQTTASIYCQWLSKQFWCLVDSTKKINLLTEFSDLIFIKFYFKACWNWTCIQNKLAYQVYPPDVKTPKCFRNFIPWTPTRALPWTHCKAYNNSRPAPAFHSIRRFNLCSKITHMWRRWGTSQNFFLAFYWWTWKINSYQKNYRKGPIKNMLHFLKKYKEKSNTCEEGGAHLRLSFWHLLMNLKNK